MKAGAGSRVKGDAYMRHVCRQLAQWYTRKDWAKAPMADCPFRPRSTSIMPVEGHWRGAGDILWRPDLKFGYSVECKKIGSWSLDQAWNPKWPVLKWWQQCKDQAKRADLHPLLIFSKNHADDFAMIDNTALAELQGLSGFVPSPRLEVGSEDAIVCLLTDLMTHSLN